MHKRAIYLYVIWSKLVCSYLLGFLFEFLDGTLVDATTLVDHVTSGGRLARVDVANDHDVDMSLILRHVED